MRAEKGPVESRWLACGERCIVCRENRLGHAAESGEVAAKPRLEIIACYGFAAAMQHFKLVLRIGKPLQPALADRIENDNARAAFSRTAQIAQHARMIGARILTDDENGVSHFEIFQKH